MLLGGQTTEFHMYNYTLYLSILPIASYSTGFGFLIVCLSHNPHPSQMRLARLIVCLEEGKVVERKTRKRFFRTVCSHLASFNMSPLSNDANWRC